MKKIFLLFAVLFSMFINAQAYKGNGDVKFQVGAGFQSGANSIVATADFGIGENMSYGFVGSYILGNSDYPGLDAPGFSDKFDFKARFNANLGNVLKLDEKMDVYPGLDLGLRNFGAHLGFRYFFTDGFGLFTEAGIPIASYGSSNKDGYKVFNNQFVFSVGASFNL